MFSLTAYRKGPAVHQTGTPMRDFSDQVKMFPCSK